MRRAVPVLILVGALLLGACSDDGNAEQEIADRVIATFQDRLTLQGFEPADDEDDEDDDVAFETEECELFAATFPDGDQELPGEVASAESGDYERETTSDPAAIGSLEIVSGAVGFVEEDADLDAYFALFRDERFVPCLTEMVNTTFAADLAQPDAPPITLQGLTVGPTAATGVGDDTVGLHFAADLAAPGVTIPFVGDFIVARSGTAAVLATAVIVGTAPTPADPVALLSELLADIVDERD